MVQILQRSVLDMVTRAAILALLSVCSAETALHAQSSPHAQSAPHAQSPSHAQSPPHTQSPLPAHSPATEPADPFNFLGPTIQFSDDDRQKLDDREVVIRILPADGHELAAMAAATLDASPDAFVRSITNIVDLKKSPLTPQLGRFSPTPRLEDLRALTLEDVDAAEIRSCQPEHCGLKLEPGEIARLQRAMPAEGANASKGQLDQEFRRVLLERVEGYLRHGLRDDAKQFSTLIQDSPYVRAHAPALASYLERYPTAHLPGAESFIYWSKEMYAWKPMVTLTHVTVLRGRGADGLPEVLVASRDIFSTRYTSGSLTLTLLFRGAEARSHYLVYINRTWVDGVRALWRPLVEHRIKKQARAIFADVRARIERNAGATSGGRRGTAPQRPATLRK